MSQMIILTPQAPLIDFTFTDRAFLSEFERLMRVFEQRKGVQIGSMVEGERITLTHHSDSLNISDKHIARNFSRALVHDYGFTTQQGNRLFTTQISTL